MSMALSLPHPIPHTVSSHFNASLPESTCSSKSLWPTQWRRESPSSARRHAGNLVAAVVFARDFAPTCRCSTGCCMTTTSGTQARFVHQFGTPGGWAPLSSYTLNRQSAGGGSLVVTGSHFLDRMIHFWGMPETCSLADDGFNGPEANCVARFSYPGLDGMAKYSKTARLPGGLVIEAEHGTVVLADTDDAAVKFYPRAWPMVCETIESQTARPQTDVFQLQILDFVQACRSTGRPTVDAEQGLQSLRLTEALYKHRSPLREERYTEASR